MFGWFRRNPIRKLETEYAWKLEQARDVQRKGDIVGYSRLMAEADAILERIRDAESVTDRSASTGTADES